MNIIHTSYDIHGQIYIPGINRLLMILCILLVLVFKTSSNLAAAYGMSVMGTMTITSILIGVIALRRWKWKPVFAVGLSALFLAVDLPYLFANFPKIIHGAWFPLVSASVFFMIMLTWKTGKEKMGALMKERFLPIDLFMQNIDSYKGNLPRVKGTALFMTSNMNVIPVSLLHHFKHNKVLHEKVILLTVEVERIPRTKSKNKIKIKELGNGFYQIIASIGYMEKPDIPLLLTKCRKEKNLKIDDVNQISYYLGHETLLSNGRSKMYKWQKELFILLSKNARPASFYFNLPQGRVVELGIQISI
jgi:KUP system potassium uptake protein